MPTPTPTPAPTPVGSPAGDWQLKFDEEFNGTTLDLSRWNTCYPEGCTNAGNHELECYVPENVSVADGIARLKAEDRSVSCLNGGQTIQQPYASGMLTTQGKFEFQYGYIEARTRGVKGQGLWPALWTLPADLTWPPEIDLMEILGHDPFTIYFTYHYGNTPANHRSSGAAWNGPNFSSGWHVIAVDWGPQAVHWYVDGVERHTPFTDKPEIYNKPMYFLANLAVGGDWPGSPDRSTVFPSYFDIDYVRIWQK